MVEDIKPAPGSKPAGSITPAALAQPPAPEPVASPADQPDEPKQDVPKHADQAKKPKPPKPPKQPGSGVGLAIAATVIIVIALGLLATFAYVMTAQ